MKKFTILLLLLATNVAAVTPEPSGTTLLPNADISPTPTTSVAAPANSRASDRFHRAEGAISRFVSGKTALSLFGSVSLVQARVVRSVEEDRVPPDPTGVRQLRPILDDGVLMGQLNLGYNLDWYVGKAGAFIEADLTDLRGESDRGRFGYGVFLTGPKGFRLWKYIDPMLALGYRRVEDVTQEVPGVGQVVTEIKASDITNFYLSLNITVPVTCLFDDTMCEESVQ